MISASTDQQQQGTLIETTKLPLKLPDAAVDQIKYETRPTRSSWT